MAPKLGKIRRINGIAGQVAYRVPVTYPGESTKPMMFVGTVYGTSVVMVTSDGLQIQVDEPGRFGPFGTEWVRRFYA